MTMTSQTNKAFWKAELERVPTDQSEFLPPYTSFQLFVTKPLLKDADGFDWWKVLITDALQAYRAMALIDIKIEHPKPDAANGDNWLHASLFVGKWLKRCIHPELRERIDQNKDLQLADEIFGAIEKEMEGGLFISDCNAALEFITAAMNPEKYTSTRAYVQDIRRRAVKMAIRDMGLSPYCTWAIVIGQVRKRYPIFAQIAVDKLTVTKKGRGTFNNADLLQSFDRLIDGLTRME